MTLPGARPSGSVTPRLAPPGLSTEPGPRCAGTARRRWPASVGDRLTVGAEQQAGLVVQLSGPSVPRERAAAGVADRPPDRLVIWIARCSSRTSTARCSARQGRAGRRRTRWTRRAVRPALYHHGVLAAGELVTARGRRPARRYSRRNGAVAALARGQRHVVDGRLHSGHAPVIRSSVSEVGGDVLAQRKPSDSQNRNVFSTCGECRLRWWKRSSGAPRCR